MIDTLEGPTSEPGAPKIRIAARRVTIGFTLVLVAAACSDDGAATTTSSTPADTTSIAPTTTTSAPVTTSTSASPDLKALLNEFEATAFRATYAFRDGGEETTVVVSQDPTRIPPVWALIVPDADSKFIVTGSSSIFCDTLAEQCFSVAGDAASIGDGLLGPFIGGLFLGTDVDPSTATFAAHQTIAGREGICFTFIPALDTGFGTEEIRQCVDAEHGFTLIVERSSADPETVLEIIEFEAPLEDDFTPNAPVVDSP